MITAFLWKTSDHAGEWVTPDRLPQLAKDVHGGPDVIWIDLHDPTPEEEELVFKKVLPVHSLTLEDITKPRRLPDSAPHFPKVEEFPDYLFVIVNPLVRRLMENISAMSEDKAEAYFAEGSPVTQLSAVLNQHILITHHYQPMIGIECLRDFLNRHPTAAGRGPDYLFHVILDEMVDEYAPVLDHF